MSGLNGFMLDTKIAYPVMIGLIGGIFLYRLVRFRWSFLTTFQHELAHVTVAVICLRKVKKFVSTSSEGGYMQYARIGKTGIGDHFIGLAPYYLPVFTVLLVLLRPLLVRVVFPWYDGFLGLTLGFYLFGNVDDIRGNWKSKRKRFTLFEDPRRTDFEQSGYARSIIIIAVCWTIIWGIMFQIILHGYPGVWIWLGEVWRGSVDFYASVYGRFSP